MITRMLGRGPDAPCGAPATGPVGVAAGWAGVPSPVSATARMPRPAPARTPPATSPPFRNVRRSTFLCSFGSMSSMRALILGPAVALGMGLPAPLAEAGQSGPACTPASLSNSALQDGVVTMSPLAGSRDATPQAQISFLGVPAGDLHGV